MILSGSNNIKATRQYWKGETYFVFYSDNNFIISCSMNILSFYKKRRRHDISLFWHSSNYMSHFSKNLFWASFIQRIDYFCLKAMCPKGGCWVNTFWCPTKAYNGSVPHPHETSLFETWGSSFAICTYLGANSSNVMLTAQMSYSRLK